MNGYIEPFFWSFFRVCKRAATGFSAHRILDAL